MLKKKINLCLAATGLLGSCLALGVNFDSGAIPKGTTPYGEGTRLEISSQGESGRNALAIHYNDQTKGKWCNKGVWIELPRSISWEEFDFLTFKYRQGSGIKMLACTLQDADNNMWYAFQSTDLNKKLYNDINFEKEMFRFSYNIKDSSIKKAEKKAPVNKILFYIGTLKLNTDEQYTFVLEKIAFNRNEDKIAMKVTPSEKNTTPYGEYGDVKNIISETVKSSVGDGIVKLEFSDSTPDKWYHKGVRIKLDTPIAWSDFECLATGYQISEKPLTVGCYLRDDRGLWWESFSRNVKAGEIQKEIFEKDSFHIGQLTYRYSDKKYEKTGKVEEIFLYFGDSKVNKGVQFTGSFSDTVFIKELATGNYKYEIVNDFPLQWKNNNITEKGVMLVDGKPFFPLVLYSCMGIDPSSGTYRITHYTGATDDATNRSRFKAVKDAGFNTMMSYTLNLYGQKVSGPNWQGSERATFPGEGGETTAELYREGARKFMDYCRSAGMMAMVGANSTYVLPKPLPFNNRKGKWEEYKKRIADNIAELKDHPALLTWYMIDEPSSLNTPPNDLLQCYQYVKNLDQDHPMLIAACDPRNDFEYYKATDIMAPDSYPLGFDKPIINDYNLLTKYLAEQDKGRPYFWQLIQIAQWPNWGPRTLPTCAQIRLQCFLALLHDLKGLCFWEHMNYPEREPEHWAGISKAINSLHSFTDDLLYSEKVLRDFTVSNPRILSILHQVKGKKYLLMLSTNPVEEKIGDNPTPQPVAQGKARFEFPGRKIAKIEVIDENGKGELELGKTRIIKPDSTNSFSDEFGNYATHAYRLYLGD